MLIRMDAASPTSRDILKYYFERNSHQRVETRGRGVLSNTLSRGSRGILLKFIAGQWIDWVDELEQFRFLWIWEFEFFFCNAILKNVFEAGNQKQEYIYIFLTNNEIKGRRESDFEIKISKRKWKVRDHSSNIVIVALNNVFFRGDIFSEPNYTLRRIKLFFWVSTPLEHNFICRLP